MTELNNIKTIVMGRVHTIRVLQMLVTTTTLSVVALGVSLWGIGREVWVARVIQDEPAISLSHFTLTDLFAVVHFYTIAFLDTRLIVQMLSLATVVAFVYLAHSALQLISIYVKGTLRTLHFA